MLPCVHLWFIHRDCKNESHQNSCIVVAWASILDVQMNPYLLWYQIFVTSFMTLCCMHLNVDYNLLFSTMGIWIYKCYILQLLKVVAQANCEFFFFKCLIFFCACVNFHQGLVAISLIDVFFTCKFYNLFMFNESIISNLDSGNLVIWY